jgi:hypothetical protein
MVITFTLQAAYSGATYVAGPFDISGTTSGGVTTLLGDNISKADLLTGVTISNIDDSTTGGTIQSVDGVCSNSIQWLVSGGQVLDTYTFNLYCTEDEALHPFNSAAFTSVVFNATELGVIPSVGATFVKIGGSPNTDYVYGYEGVTGEAETATTLVAVLTVGEFTCDVL